MTIKSLLVKIGADNKELETAMERSRVSLDKVGKSMAIAGALITAAMGAMIVKTVKTGDEYDKLSQRIGISVEMLSGYSHAADLAGTTVEGFGKAVAKLSDNMVEAYTKGTGPAADSFKILGIEVADSSGKLKTSEEVMLEMADRFAGMEDGALKTSMAMNIMGRGGTELIPMLNAGAAGLKAQREEADRLGITMSTSAARACADLKDNQERLQASLRGVGQQIAMNLIPAITPLIEKITNTIAKVSDWIKENREIAGALAKVALAIGVFLTVGGTMLMILPRLIAGLKMLGLAKMGLLGPIGLVAAALAVAAVGYMAVKNAQDAAEAASRRFEEANSGLMKKLNEARKEAGMSAKEFADLCRKYEDNAAAMGMAIFKGKENIAIQEALKKVGAEHKKGIDEQRKALDDARKAQEEKLVAEGKAHASLETMTQLRAALTDEIAKATMSETQYTLYSLGQQLQARVADIQKSALAERQKNAMILQAKQSHEDQVRAIDAKATEDMVAKAMEQRDRILEERKKGDEQYLTMKQNLQDSLALMGLTGLQHELTLLEQKKAAEIAAIEANTLLNQTQKDNLIAMTKEFYANEEKLATGRAKTLTELEQETASMISGIYQNFWDETLEGFRKWGEGKRDLFDTLGNAYEDFGKMARGAIISWLSSLAAAAAKEFILAKASAIGNVIKSVMALPFPANLALVGGAIAAVSALFSKIKMGEGGLVTRPTTALIGEKGPELVIPLKKLGLLGAGGPGGGTTIQQTLHFHGNINSAYSVDEISKILGERTLQAVQRGRRF